jgi:parvulin-like peptidyl-prolyl isomerase
MRLFRLSTLLILALCAGCGLLHKKPKKVTPGLPGSKLTLPGSQMPTVSPPSLTRSQKPEQPPIIALPPSTPADGKVEVKVVAYVNNMPIFDSEVREALMMRVRDLEGLSDSQREKKLKELRGEEIDKLIDREVILDTAFKRLKKMPPKVLEDLQKEASKEFDHRLKEMKQAYKLKNDEQLSKFMTEQGMSVAGFKRSMERQFIATEYMRNMIFPTLQHIPLSQLRAYYDEHPDDFTDKDKAKWQDIFIDASKFADRGAAKNYAAQVTATLRGGADFVATSKQLQQAGYNPLPGPEGIGETKGDVKPGELETAVFSLAAGQVSNPVEVAGGFHVVKVTERSRPGKRPFDADTQNEIKNKLLNAMANREYRRLVEQMKETAIKQKLE